jgi:hypothetical protein
MKTPLIYFFTLLVVFLSSCSDEEPTLDNQKRYGGEVSFTANGQIYTLSENAFYVVEGILSLESLFDGQTQLSFDINAGIAETSYDIVSNNAAMIFYTDEAKGNFYYIGQTPVGKIQILEIDEEKKTMSGTFYAQLKRETATMTIANGTFTDVPYVIQQELKGTDPIAKIDGEIFKGKLASWGTGSSTIIFTYTNDKRILDFSLPSDLAAGMTYSVTSFNENSYERIRFIDGLYSYKANAGTVTITQYVEGSHVKGTYNIEVESYPIGGMVKSITEGTFDVHF